MSADPNPAKAIFLEAVERHVPDGWPAFLDRACAGQPHLRGRVEALLAAHREVGTAERGDGAEGAGPAATVDEPSVHDQPGTAIGPYRLLEPIGEGGFGVVFVAEQARPIRRRVALKVLKPGMDTRQVVARFEAERQALALMDHPNIAQIHDGGTTPDGRPFFVMELVKGVPITDYCDRCSLTTGERLELLLSVCHAVQHAHQKGVIHRDLKPSNVLVTIQDGKPAVKVIDFGIAKAINQRLSEHTVATGFHQLVGTPLYMSPEQAELSPLDVDTRADIYALGVLLYELLTGTTPLEKERLSQAGYDEMRRLIREEEPPLPSARLSTLQDKLTTLAAQRRTDPRQLLRTVRGELDWIVMKCLEKDRNRRYETANGLARDIGRYLADEPVHACPPSAGYRLRKFVRRNKHTVAGLAILGALSLAGVGALAASLGWAARDREALAREATRDRADRQTRLRDEVIQAVSEVAESYSLDRPAEAWAALERAERVLDRVEEGETLPQRVRQWRADLKMVARLEEIRLQQAEVRDGGFDTAGADPGYRDAFGHYGVAVESLAPDEAAARLRASAVRDALTAALDDWALVKRAGKLPGWEHLLEVAQRADDDPRCWRFRKAFRSSDQEALTALARDDGALPRRPAAVVLLAVVLRSQGQLPLAVEVLRQAQRRYPVDFWVNQNLGQYLLLLPEPRPSEAVGFLRVALVRRPLSPGVHVNLGLALQGAGLPAEAERAYRTATHLQPGYAGAYYNLGRLFRQLGRPADAEGAYREAVGLKPQQARYRYGLALALLDRDQLHGAEAEFRAVIRLTPADATALARLEGILSRQGKLAEAEAAYRAAVGLAPLDPQVHANLAFFLQRQNKPAGAEVAFREAVRLNPKADQVRANFGTVLAHLGKFVEAEDQYKEIVRRNPGSPWAHVTLAVYLAQRDRPAEAEAAYRMAVGLQPENAEVRMRLLLLLDKEGKLAGAEIEAQEIVRLLPREAWPHHRLGYMLARRGKHAEAEAEFRTAARLQPGDYWARHAVAVALLSQGKWQEAEVAFDEAIRRPQDAAAWLARGNAYAEAGLWEKAQGALARLTDLTPGDPWGWYDLALAHLGAGKIDAYHRTCATMLARLGDTRDPRTAARLVQACVAGPGVVPDTGRLVRLAERGALAWPGSTRLVGAALYRAGRFQEALRRFQEVKDGPPGDPWEGAFLAMVYHRLGQPQEARRRLTAVRQWQDRVRQQAQCIPSPIPWYSRVEIDHLCVEAEKVLQEKTTPE
jgi:serine/threonine protein kinase/tetratricopeptide (TPR) repeat protein